jgi:hypothetical protein
MPPVSDAVSRLEEDMSPEELLDQVQDQESFVRFVTALTEERAEAAAEENANPMRYIVDGTRNWKNAEISTFLYSSLEYFEERPFHRPEKKPSWRMFAEFLYFGKIYE